MGNRVRHGNQDPTRFLYLDKRSDKSFGDDAIRLYEKSGRKALPWQAKLVNHILAHQKDWIFIHSNFGYSVPRRNGKNEIACILELYGLFHGWHIMHTAHLTNTSTTAFSRLLTIMTDSGYIDGTRGKQTKAEAKEHPPDFTASHSIGREKIVMCQGGGYINFRTRTGTGGLGEGYDLLIIDEAQEYTDDQDTALKYVVSDSMNPLTVFTGTPPTSVSSGTVFMKMRTEALQGKRPHTGWAEWSVPSMSRIDDRELWYLTNPSLGYHLTERVIETEAGRGDDTDFNIQRLGLWIEYNQASAISEVEWDALKVDNPNLRGKIYAGIKYGKDGTNVALSIAVRTDDDRVFVETIDCKNARFGDMWILKFLKSADVGYAAVDGASGQAILKDEMYDEDLEEPLFPTVKEIIKANALFEQCLEAKTICHSGQPSLRDSATNCDKRAIGANGGFGYKSLRDDIDIALLDSAILAHWLCVEYSDEEEQVINY